MVFEDLFETARKTGPVPRYFSVDSVEVFYMISGRAISPSEVGSSFTHRENDEAFLA